MITKAVIDSSGADHTVEWHWHQERATPSSAHSYVAGDWWPEIETIDGETPDLTEEQLAVVQEACANDYPLTQYQDDSATDAEYYEIRP